MLLSVGAYPVVDWQAHYYAQRQLLPYSRQMQLTSNGGHVVWLLVPSYDDSIGKERSQLPLQPRYHSSTAIASLKLFANLHRRGHWDVTRN